MERITLKAARVNANLNQYQAAKKLGVSRETISNWENGKSSPSTAKFKDIERVYGIKYDSIIFFTNKYA